MKIDAVHLFSTGGVNVLTARDQADKIETLEAEVANLKRLLKMARNRLVASAPAETTEIRGALH